MKFLITNKAKTAEDRKKARAELASVVGAEVEAVLAQYDNRIRKQTRISVGLLSGTVAASVSALSRRKHQAIDAMQGELALLAKEFVAQIAQTAVLKSHQVGGQVRSGGQDVSNKALIDGISRVDDQRSMLIEDWAGPVAGPTFLEANFGIARSTLYRWQRRNEVVGFLKGGRKYVFPLAQFVDGRPAAGLSDILQLIGHPRTTWFWLTHACPVLDGRKPIDLLRMDVVSEVIDAAHELVGREDPLR